jgi:hypothetical protein
MSTNTMMVTRRIIISTKRPTTTVASEPAILPARLPIHLQRTRPPRFPPSLLEEEEEEEARAEEEDIAVRRYAWKIHSA